MRPLDLIRSSTVRLAAFYLLLFTLSTAAVLGVVYWFTAGFIDRYTADTIQREADELQARWRTQGYVGLLRLVSERSGIPRTGMIYAVATPTGDILAGNLVAWPEQARRGGADGWIGFDIRPVDGGGRERPALARVVGLGPFGALLVGQDMTDRLVLRERIATGFFWAVSLALLVGGLGAVLMARRVSERIEGINTTIDRIAAGAFADRMPLAGSGDELDRLALKLNAMLDRIGSLMQGLRDVTDNVAHDLRTPLSRLRARLELAAEDAGTDPALRRNLEGALVEVDRLLQVFAAMLSIAAVESGRARADFATVNLATVASDMAELFEPLAEARGIRLDLDAPAAAPVSGSAQLLAQALSNLLDNAVKYTPPGGRIDIAVRAGDGGEWLLQVSDTGPGIPADQRGRVLERFVRLEAHRGTPGHGLGLSLVAAVARLHDAALTLADGQPGLVVALAFPGRGTPGDPGV